MRELVLILDFGSQTTQLIARRIRESNVYCEIHPGTLSLEAIKAKAPKAIVLSGGPSSVYDEGAPSVDRGVFELGVPVLGICYGAQLMAHLTGGHVERAEHREYGPATMQVSQPRGVLTFAQAGESLDVWMSHGDRIESLPTGFETLATTPSTPFCVVGHHALKQYGMQFHPEVVHTKRGKAILDAFLFEVAGLTPSWTPASFVDEEF